MEAREIFQRGYVKAARIRANRVFLVEPPRAVDAATRGAFLRVRMDDSICGRDRDYGVRIPARAFRQVGLGETGRALVTPGALRDAKLLRPCLRGRRRRPQNS
jgi:hypothetical protein